MRRLATGALAIVAMAATVSTVNYSVARLGSTSVEPLLTPTNVQSATFGRRGAYPVDGPVYAQPLYTPGVTISSVTYNTIFIVTMHCSAYLFDADRVGAEPLWGPVSLCTPRSTFPANYTGANLTYSGYEYGCLSTPVIDAAALKAYAVCYTSTPSAKLSKIDLVTHAVTSAVITATYPGTGDARTGEDGDADTCTAGTCTFYPKYHGQRAGLLLINDTVVTSFGSLADSPPYHGWIMMHNTSDFSLAHAWMSTPTSGGGGVWPPGGGLSSDGTEPLAPGTKL